MTEPPKSLPMSDLVDRRVYVIRSRNLAVGVWRAETSGFIGIREKFKELYLFEEYHYETGAPFGTAGAVEDLGVDVPADIPLAEYLVNQEGAFLKDDEGYLQPNTALFDLLKPYDDAEYQRRHEENLRLEEEAKSLAYKPKTKEEVEAEERRAAANEWYREERRARPDMTREELSDVFKEFVRRRKGENDGPQ